MRPARRLLARPAGGVVQHIDPAVLRAVPGRFCVDCMAVALDIPAWQVSMARHRLAATGVLRVERAHCSGCNRLRSVVSSGALTVPSRLVAPQSSIA